MESASMGSKPKHKTSWIWLAVLIVIIAGVAGFLVWYQGYSKPAVSPANTAINNNGSQMVGGPCGYAQYPGVCKVTALEEASDQPAGSNSGASIKFTFTLNKGETITQAGFELTPGKIYQKTLALNGAGDKVGSQACLDEFKIRQNQTYDCTLEVITSGTCTPEIFKFKNIDDKCLMY